MKQKLIVTIAALTFLFFAVTIGTVQISAQQPTLTPGAPVPTPTPDLERRIYQLEVAQEQTIEALKSSNTFNQVVMAVVGGFIAILVGVQSFVTASQVRREGRRDERQVRREEEWDRIERTGIEQVSKVMNVVQQTLESRLEIDRTGIGQVSKIMNVVQQTLESHLKTEEQALEMVENVRRQLDDALKKLEPTQQFYRNFQKTIRRLREAIEERASELAQTSRHDFRGVTNNLNSFAQQFDTFKTEFEALEEEREGEPRPQFSPRVSYILGIAVLYVNWPDIAKQYLEEVVRFREPQPNETELDFNRRVANAYYYLGVIESNFANHKGAIDFFEEANKRDPRGTDLLTRVVTAEAYVMMKDFAKATQFITQIEEGLHAMERTQGRLRNHQRRLQSRAALIRANMTILGREDNWRQQVQQLLEPVYVADPQYYYATATLAQVYADQGDSDKAQELFNEAYTIIERSGHLLTVTEARSKILLLMVAGMCCEYGLMDEKRSEVHLDEADSLRGSLPKIDSQVCTVFSPLSKRNENSEIIRHHIESIREGKVLL